MIDIGQPASLRIHFSAGDRNEVDIVDADIADRARRNAALAILAAPAVDKIDQRIADALDRRHIQFHRASLVVKAPCTEFERALVRYRRIFDTECECANALTMLACEALRKRILFGIDDEIDVALAVQGHILVTMASDRGKTHLLEQGTECFGVRRCILDELETIGPHRVVPRLKLHVCLLSMT